MSECVFIEADYCVDPDSKILLADLTWITAKDIKVDTPIVGFDEGITGHSHSFRSSTIIGKKLITRPRVKVITTEGSTVVSFEHRFLARNVGYGRKWIKAEDLRPGMCMTFLCRPWEIDESRDAGYLAGFFDGEGWVHNCRVGYGQNAGPTLERVRALLKAKGFTFVSTNCRTTAKTETTSGLRYSLSFLGMIRPHRLLAKAATHVWENRRTWGKRTPLARVLSIEHLGYGDVIALETSTKTFISDGFFSHNCAIEAILTGWFCGDPDYIRLARLGVHAYLTSHLVGRAADLTWSDGDLGDYFKKIKKQYPVKYHEGKITVHGTNFGLTPFGMAKLHPHLFTISSATALQTLYYRLCPKLKTWHNHLRQRAHRQGYLGGADHPFHYKHWFWEVLKWSGGKVSLGRDANRVVAFYPQSTAAGILKETCLRLMDPSRENYIGDAFHGQTPIRALIHDSILNEVPLEEQERVIRALYREMTRPILELPCPPEWGLGSHLSIGVAIKVGPTWGSMEEVDLKELGVASDTTVIEPEEELDEVA